MVWKPSLVWMIGRLGDMYDHGREVDMEKDPAMPSPKLAKAATSTAILTGGGGLWP
jgi:hypothetical protein